MPMELVHGKPNIAGFEVLDVDYSAFKQLIQLAKKNGWEPSEKTLKATGNLSSWCYWDNPGEVSRTDAKEMASALKRALQVPELKEATLPRILSKQKGGVEAVLSDPNYTRFRGMQREMVERFIKFLQRGSFAYAISD